VARYGKRFKERVVAQLLPPESASLEAVAQRVGIGVGTLERWRAEALALPADDAADRPWSAAARLEALIVTASMDEIGRNGWCRERGIYPSELESWRQDAIAGLGPVRDAGAKETREDRRRIKELERELRRKDKALAETAALLVLSKKVAAIFHKGEDE
jgi:transposase-like protein